MRSTKSPLVALCFLKCVAKCDSKISHNVTIQVNKVNNDDIFFVAYS